MMIHTRRHSRASHDDRRESKRRRCVVVHTILCGCFFSDTVIEVVVQVGRTGDGVVTPPGVGEEEGEACRVGPVEFQVILN
jgi:hypothetical protein